ncbi:uncharacterized protein LOC120010245 [Tripterygium wilfordii]|uniref:uncharacterized protein LOC120010245 n=1 Tax=Tripterygium wilfordii TaxID=458696 RepID=UPI0018F80B66|nr:uncharacterized protein LOC120010245 [Tripterygium wilfordii]
MTLLAFVLAGDPTTRRCFKFQLSTQPPRTSCCKTSEFRPFSSTDLKMNWIQRKIYLYNVTFGLYMLDWWERCLFNTLVVVLMWFIFYNTSRYLTDFGKRHLW